MADHLFPETRQRARKEHRCIWCYYPIAAGEQYVQQESFWDGLPQRQRYHAECWDVLLSEGPHFEAGKRHVTEHSPPPPKLTRSQKRYEAWLDADCGLTFGEFLRSTPRP